MAETMRLDRFLWFAHIVKTRSFAQAMASSGHLRIDGRATDKPAYPVRIGTVLTFVTHGGTVRALRIEALPTRRGPAAEARACYLDLVAENKIGSADNIENVSHQSAND